VCRLACTCGEALGCAIDDVCSVIAGFLGVYRCLGVRQQGHTLMLLQPDPDWARRSTDAHIHTHTQTHAHAYTHTHLLVDMADTSVEGGYKISKEDGSAGKAGR